MFNLMNHIYHNIPVSGLPVVEHCRRSHAEGTVEKVWSQTTQAFGHIDIHVNNAGMGSGANPKPVVNYSDEHVADGALRQPQCTISVLKESVTLNDPA